jgi:hypothetical protein
LKKRSYHKISATHYNGEKKHGKRYAGLLAGAWSIVAVLAEQIAAL